ncbi:uncharacterized protein IL334_001491 [Kwoniella shivajii]|uniref:C2H2-type domain-containing protein n=1 Tax=Kwoniella shivajii TaxID=564305 RepID=A0ABZ1CT78_9TREE|nr:hypothetical protein IL334_001491 [Kwoniella shivajii]
MSRNPDAAPAVHCKWDFCTDTFFTFSEWETHFTVEHIAYAQPVVLTGRRLRKREAEGHWELVDEEARPAEQLPINPHPSQTTGDTTTTTHTLSFPIPPSFQSIPDPPASMSTNLLLPPETFDDNDDGHDRSHDIDYQEQDRLYSSFLRSPSPAIGQQASGSRIASGSASYQPPPPGQRSQTPPWTDTQALSHSQPSPYSPHPSGSRPITSQRPTPSTPEIPRSGDVPAVPVFTSPFQPSQASSKSHSTPNRSDTSQVNSNRERADSTGSQTAPGAIPLRFGAALSTGERGSPFKDSPKAAGSTSAGVGFGWGGGGSS